MPKRKYQKSGEAFQKTLTFALLAIVAAVILFSIAILSPNLAGNIKGSLGDAQGSETKLHFIAVGQGDAVLIEQNGEFALIDTGEKSAQQQLNSYLSNAGVQNIKYLIMTHPHSDHMGGMSGVIEQFNVETIILPDFDKAPMPSTAAFEKLLDIIKAKGVKAESAKVGTQYILGSGKITILGNGIKTDNYNNISLATLFEVDGISYLSTGDAEKELETELLLSIPDIKANVFKAAHHGSKTSNTAPFIGAVSPDIVVVCCGKDNSYGHPNKEALASFAAVGADVLRTDESGTVIVYLDKDGKCKIATER